MDKITWNQLPNSLTIGTQEGETLDLPSPEEIDIALNDFEAQAGLHLPTSYRQFIHWFGPGTLSEWFDICAPIPQRLSGLVADVHDIDKQREMLHDPEGYWATSVAPELLRRFVLFASTGGGDWFFWDTADVRSNADHEYGIYYHDRGNTDGKVELIAQSFKDFVTAVCLGTKYPLSDEEREAEPSHSPGWPSKSAE